MPVRGGARSSVLVATPLRGGVTQWRGVKMSKARESPLGWERGGSRGRGEQGWGQWGCTPCVKKGGVGLSSNSERS